MEPTDNGPLRTKLTVEINNKFYEVCSMNVDMNEEQFYYSFLYPKTVCKKIYNHNEQKQTGRPDHISFHQDGTVHLRLKKNKKIHVVQIPDHSFIPASEKITPLLIHSVFKRQGEYILPQSSELKSISSKQCTVYNHLSYQCFQDFSVILFLVPENINLEESLRNFYCVLPSSKLPLSLLGHQAGRILAWPGWALDCIITDLILPVSSNDYHCAFAYYDFAYYDLDKVIPTLLKQRIKNKL